VERTGSSGEGNLLGRRGNRVSMRVHEGKKKETTKRRGFLRSNERKTLQDSEQKTGVENRLKKILR